MNGYGGAARFYDGEYDGFRQDVDFYIHRLLHERVRGPVLTPGCGTGRVAVPLAEAGFRVSGFDHSEAMLRRARRRRRGLVGEARLRVRFSRQDMVDFRFNYPFAAVVLAFSTFNLLADSASRSSCLARIAEHSLPGTLLLADLFNPSRTMDITRRSATQFRLPPYGHLVEKTVEEQSDSESGPLTVRYSYQERRWVDDAVVDELTVEFRLARIARSEMAQLLQAEGFDVEDVFGDYAGHAASDRRPRLIFQARKLA